MSEEPYTKWNCITLREFDVWDGTKYIHITEVKCLCPDGSHINTQVQDYDWSWIETVMNQQCKNMTAKACIYLQDPSSSRSVDVGSYVTVRMGMKNCGTSSGNFYGEIFKNGSRCAGKWNEQLEPGGVLKFFTSACDISSMPNSTVNIKFCGGHAEGGWHQDFSKTIILTPAAPPPCDQPVRVVDEDGVKIDNARVDCYEGSSFKAHCTTYYGDCLLSFLDVGTSYMARASKTGYECLTCERTFTACTSRITLSLKKQPTTCNQSFKVVDTSGATVTKNCIIVVREGGAWKNECATSTSGTCTVGLIKGTSLRACIEQVPSGYELTSESCKSFTACTSRITLKLKKSCTCTSWQKGECISTTHRRYTRTCTPPGCDTETEDRPDSTCEVAPPPPPCSEYIDEESCLLAGCSWYDGACHEYAPVQCSDYTDALTCEAEGCYWWTDGTCHDIEEPSLDKENTEFCGFSIYDEEDDQRTLTIGKQYTVAAKLCWVKYLGIGGCNILHPSDCVEGYEVPGVKLQFKKADGTKILETPNTNEDGWAGAFWTPTENDAGAYSVKLIFPGNDTYNACESNKIELEVKSTPTGKFTLSAEVKDGRVYFTGVDEIDDPGRNLRLYRVKALKDEVTSTQLYTKDDYSFSYDIDAPEEEETYYVCRCWGVLGVCEPTITCWRPEKTDNVTVTPEKLTAFGSLISFLTDTLGITESQAKLIVYGGGALLALMFIMPMFRR